MDPTRKKQPKSTTTIITTAKAHPHPHHPTTTTTTNNNNKAHHPTDSDPTYASSTIHTISKHFSKLYTNHHKAPASKNESNPPPKPSIGIHLEAKSISKSAIEDTPSKSITKSSHRLRKTVAEIEKDRLRDSIIGATDEKSSRKSYEGCEIKRASESGKTEQLRKPSKKESAKKGSHEGCDIKKQSALLSWSQESGLKGTHRGDEVKKIRPLFSLAVTGGERRRSICSSYTELADFFSCNGVKVVSVDMPPFMQVHAVDSARKTYDSLEKFTSKTLALSLKKEFDGVYGPAWHCIVGTSFGSFVTHSVGGFLYFSMDQKLYILLFKTTVQRAD